MKAVEQEQLGLLTGDRRPVAGRGREDENRTPMFVYEQGSPVPLGLPPRDIDQTAMPPGRCDPSEEPGFPLGRLPSLHSGQPGHHQPVSPMKRSEQLEHDAQLRHPGVQDRFDLRNIPGGSVGDGLFLSHSQQLAERLPERSVRTVEQLYEFGKRVCFRFGLPWTQNLPGQFEPGTIGQRTMGKDPQLIRDLSALAGRADTELNPRGQREHRQPPQNRAMDLNDPIAALVLELGSLERVAGIGDGCRVPRDDLAHERFR
jgi:hypothetical protein